MTALKRLQQHEMIEISPHGTLSALELGTAMSRLSVHFETMVGFATVGADSTLQSLLELLPRSREFEDMHLRRSEKKILNQLCEQGLRFPLSGNKMKDNVRIMRMFDNDAM
jgi:hypothetical protein